MSDSAQNVEIEDVLSSIRRLVSGDDWSRQPTPADIAALAGQAAPEPGDAFAERFVLTPTLRVVPPDTEAAVSDGDVGQSHAPNLEDWADPVTPQGGGDADRATPAPTDADVRFVPVELSTDDQAPRPDAALTADPVILTSRLHLEATIAEMEAAVAGRADEWEPDGSEIDARAEDWVDALPAPTLRAGAAQAQMAADAARPDEDIPFHHIDPDFVSDDNLDELAAGLGTSGAETYSAEMNEDLNAYLDQDSVIDEQMLRDLVADIVRQELQGALGERITRNVRKLVRREIYRVLASQEFD